MESTRVARARSSRSTEPSTLSTLSDSRLRSPRALRCLLEFTLPTVLSLLSTLTTTGAFLFFLFLPCLFSISLEPGADDVERFLGVTERRSLRGRPEERLRRRRPPPKEGTLSRMIVLFLHSALRILGLVRWARMMQRLRAGERNSWNELEGEGQSSCHFHHAPSLAQGRRSCKAEQTQLSLSLSSTLKAQEVLCVNLN